MSNVNNARVVPSKNLVLLIRGLIVSKVLAILVVGGLMLWLKPRLGVSNEIPPSSQEPEATSTTPLSTFQTITNVPTGLFRYGGSTAWAPIRQLVDAQIQNLLPEMQLRYVNPTTGSPSSSSGIRMLLNGQLDFAQSSRPLTDAEIAIARARGFTLEQRSIGIDGITAVVNPSLQVRGLTVDQLRQIYQGQIVNWSQIGGPDLPITPFSQRPEDAEPIIFSQRNGLQQFGSHVQYVYSTTEALRKVGSTLGGLYYASTRAVVLQCKVKPLALGHTPSQLVQPYKEPLVPPAQCPNQRNQINFEVLKNGSYPIIRNLFVVVKHQQGRQETQAGAAYTKLLLTTQGQNAIEQAGFIPLFL